MCADDVRGARPHPAVTHDWVFLFGWWIFLFLFLFFNKPTDVLSVCSCPSLFTDEEFLSGFVPSTAFQVLRCVPRRAGKGVVGSGSEPQTDTGLRLLLALLFVANFRVWHLMKCKRPRQRVCVCVCKRPHQCVCS